MPTPRARRRPRRRPATTWSRSCTTILDDRIPPLKVQLPPADFDYLCALADQDDTVATALAADWLRAELRRRRQHDGPVDADLAAVIPFPVRITEPTSTDPSARAREA